MRQQALSAYALFANLTGIFPLMGILGTVISLLPMVMDMTNVQQNFFAALTSTFWGLVFAIIFKFMDGFLAAKIEENDKNVALCSQFIAIYFGQSVGGQRRTGCLCRVFLRQQRCLSIGLYIDSSRHDGKAGRARRVFDRIRYDGQGIGVIRKRRGLNG